MVSVDAGCEWYENCGACVADAGCGWCSNDPKGVGTGTLSSLAGLSATEFSGVDNEGNVLGLGDVDEFNQDYAGYPGNNSLINIRGQYRRVTKTESSPNKITIEASFEFEGTGYISSPYFGHTSHDSSRGKAIVGIHKTKFLTELKAGFTIKPYNHTTYTVQSVQSDVMLTTSVAISSTFENVEYQVGNYKLDGTISYPDTSKTSLHGSWAPNPSKFTSQLKDGFVIATGSADHSDPASPARVGSVVNDQLVVLSAKFIQTFESEPLWVELGGRGTGLITGYKDQARITGTDPCKSGYPCHPETSFIEELRVDDVIEIVNASATNAAAPYKFFYTIAAIYDDAHLELGECILGGPNEHLYSGGNPNPPCTGMDDSFAQGKLPTTTKFKIHTAHRQSYSYARKIAGGIISHYEGQDGRAEVEIEVDTTQPGTQSLTQILGQEYAIIVQVAGASSENGDQGNPLPPTYERRMVKSITAGNKMLIDRKFSRVFDNSQFSPAVTYYHYESCPSLTYENFDHRVENGHGVISATGANHVYDNTQYAEVTSIDAEFEVNFRVGYNIIQRNTGITRRVTKIVSTTKLYVNRAFEEGRGFSNHAYQIQIRKGYDKHGSVVGGKTYNKKDDYGSDHALNWKVHYGSGGANSRQKGRVTNEQQVYAHQMKSSTTSSGAEIKMQDPYLLYPPVCYNNGRCVPKTSHSLIGVEGVDANGGRSQAGRITSSSVHNNVYDLVGLGARLDGSNEARTKPYYDDCKPVCTITAEYKGVWETRQVVGTVTAHNDTHLYTELPFAHNNVSKYNNLPVPGIIPDGITAYNALTDIQFRVRYVTGTGTVHWCPNGKYGGKDCGDAISGSPGIGYAASPKRYTLTGASKETKTKFNSETSTQWSVHIPCQTYCLDPSTDEAVAASQTCNTHTTLSGLCANGQVEYQPENRTIMTISSDTKLTVNAAFTQSNNKVQYCIGSIPALGRVTSPQGHTKVYGDSQCRFLEQLKVGYFVTVSGVERKITSITSQNEMSVGAPFPGGINTKSQMTFRGKFGTGEVSTSDGDTEVLGTLDVTETKFAEELNVGFLIMVGNNYKVVTSISSATKLTTDTAFSLYTHTDTQASYGIWRNSYNYESCFTYEIGNMPNNEEGDAYDSHTYQTKHVYVEDACEIKPGCCGFKISSVVFPDKWAYYKIRPSHSNMNIRVVATTLEDNIDLVYKKDSVPTTSSYDNTSVRESNPWALSIFAKDITCGEAFVGYNFTDTLGTQAHLASAQQSLQTTLQQDNNHANNNHALPNVNPTNNLLFPQAKNGLADSNQHADWQDYVDMSGPGDFAPSNCSFFYIGVRGDNRYPQKTGASEYDLTVYTEFEFPNFLCSDSGALDTSDCAEDQPSSACIHLGLSVVEDAAFVLNQEDSRSVMRLTPNSNMRKGAMYYSTKVHLFDGFETTFTFRISHFTVGCNSVLYPSGTCGGGDGFAFLIHEELDGDQNIGCYGAGMGFATVSREDQGNDWSRTRCTSYDTATAFRGDGTSGSYDSTASAGTGARGEPGCDSGLQSSDVSGDGKPNWNLGTPAENDDGHFGEACALGALCTIDAQGRHGCGDQNGMCGYPSCTKAIGRLVAIEFDTWNNLNLHDPKQGVSRWWINATDFTGYNDNHVAIFATGHAHGTSNNHASPNHFAATPSIPNLADGRIHEVKIKYWPQKNGKHLRTLKKNRGVPHETAIGLHGDCQDQTIGTDSLNRRPAPDHCVPGTFSATKPGNLALFIDDMKRPVLQTKITLRKGDSSEHCTDPDTDRFVLDILGNGYLGFSAATGGERTGVKLDEYGISETFDYHRGDTSHDTGLNNGYQYANEAVKLKVGAAQRHEIISWKFCNMIGCVAI
jgi:hypothetical protein